MVSYYSLAASAEVERIAQVKRATDRQNLAIGGYDRQIATSLERGEEGYQRLSNNYTPLIADANETRTRNLARVDQYGASMRDDLNRKNTQNLAKAGQSAIKRGLGNTTVYDSLQRGANFDNTRQQMALEDQLLQNRITTDSNLSKNYQDTLQNRAQRLANQWNQNTQNDNALATGRLNYIGGIKEDMDGINTVANLYSQGFQVDHASALAEAKNLTDMYNERQRQLGMWAFVRNAR